MIEAPVDSQEQVASHLLGGLLVLAPVGTGKTHALAERIARALAAGFDPARILCLTFTNRAAREVRERLEARFPDEVEQLTISTFHGLCAAILRAEARAVGLPRDFTVCDEDDSVDLLRGLSRRDQSAATDLYRLIDEQKSRLTRAELHWPVDDARVFARLDLGLRELAERYQRELQLQHLLDFADLVLLVNCLFAARPDVRARWEARYDLVQVDEVQDTHRSEYRVVYVLARWSGNLALFGDLDQTIYEWRGSDPDAIVAQFRRDFAPVAELELTVNHRSTRRLVQAAASFADSFEHRHTRNAPAEDSPDGEPIELHAAPDPRAEARWIGTRIQQLAGEDGFAYRRVGVLTGTNRGAALVSEVLEAQGVPHVTADTFEFFRRQEVKDALAYPRLLLNPASNRAMLRIVTRSLSGVGQGTLARIRRAGEPLGLRLADLLWPATFETGDPFGWLLEAYRHGSLVVFDVETTGFGPRAEVIEVAATRLRRGVPTEHYQGLLRNTVLVGETNRLHGLTDEQLQRDGRPPAEALAELFDFWGDDLLVGHNVAFDLRLVQAQAWRLGLEPPDRACVDTFHAAQRFVDAPSHALAALAELLGLEHHPSHRAAVDVAATCDLLAHLLPLVEARVDERRALVEREAPPFAPLAERLEAWRGLARRLRPPALLRRILDESGLREAYAEEPRRLGHLDELLRVFEERDVPSLDPWSALHELVDYAALAKNVDQLGRGDDDRVPVITIHQAKGLEFDTVFVAGLYDGGLPRWLSVQDGRLEEERRLFYVALTRARRRLFLSYCVRTADGFGRRPSPFLAGLDPALLMRV